MTRANRGVLSALVTVGATGAATIALIALIASIAIVTPLHAQIGPRLPRPGLGTDPDYWVGLSYGYVEGISLSDEATNGIWRFAYTSQIRATFEKTVQRGVTVGVAAGFSTARLTYEASTSSASCGFSCDANADITQYTGFVRGGGGGIGFHGMYTLEGGITRFSNFRERTSGNALPPANATNDFTFGFGGGLGFGLSRESEIYVGEQTNFVLHPEAPGQNASAPRMLVFRAGFRFGF